VIQNALSITGVPPAATTNSIQSLSPKLIEIYSSASFTLEGAVPSSSTRFAFVKQNDSCSDPQSLISDSPYSISPSPSSENFTDAVSLNLWFWPPSLPFFLLKILLGLSPSTYFTLLTFSYSTDSGSTWFKQSDSETILSIKPLTPTADSIQEIIVETTKRSETSLITGTIFNIQAVGAIPSERSVLKLTPRDDCFEGSDIIYNQVSPIRFHLTGRST